MKRWWWLAGLLLMAMLWGCGGGKPQAKIQAVSPEQAWDLVQKHQQDPNFVILDIRTPQEFQAGHIPGAVNIDFYAPDFEQQLAQLDRNKTYLVYCRTGHRSGQAMPIFQKLGFAQVYNLQGGILAWARAGLPVVTQP